MDSVARALALKAISDAKGKASLVDGKVPASELPSATEESAGIMSAEDKLKLDGITTGTVLYGYRINKNDSNPETRVGYMYDAVGMTPARMNYTTGVFDYGSWENAWFITQNKPCALRYDGTVDYYLDPNDYTKKADGTDSDLFVLLTEEPSDWATKYNQYFAKNGGEFAPVTGESAPVFAADTYYSSFAYDGNFMASIPTVWVRRWEDANYVYTALSNKQVAPDFHAYAHDAGDGYINDYFYAPMFKGVAIDGKLRSVAGVCITKYTGSSQSVHNCITNMEPGWEIWDWSKYQLITSLLTLIAKTTNLGEAFGHGIQSSPPFPLNNSSGGGRFSGTNADDDHSVKTLHIENFWSRRVETMYGAARSGTTFYYKNVRPYGHFGSYALINSGKELPSDSGYIEDLYIGNFGFVPKEVGGSNSSYYCGWLSTGTNPDCPMCFGSANGPREVYGPYSLECWATSGFARWYIGGSPCYNATHESE